MQHLLFLPHRIPYPPNKGDKIRSYHVLKHLAQRYHVHLGTFIDDPNDWQHVDNVKALCRETHFCTLNPLLAKLGSLKALASNQALTLEYYRKQEMHQWVAKVVEQYGIRRVLVFSSAMAQYATGLRHARRIIDFVDIDSDKWHQYAAKKALPMSWLYQRESRLLLEYERLIAREFDASLFVSQAEAELFTQLAPESSDKTGYFSNGVDTDYFSPEREYANPYPVNESVIVFTGAMDYWPNVDAADWFAHVIFPAVREQNPQARFYIVGSRPTPKVQALASLAGVWVSGSVPDIRPYIAHAKIAVAPLQIARGIQNKVLEAMAMAKPVVVTPQALEGIHAEPGRELWLAENAAQFIAAVSTLIAQSQDSMGRNARQKVLKNYSWSGNLAQIDALFDVASASEETS